MSKDRTADTVPQTVRKSSLLNDGLPDGRLGFSVTEFSACFGRHHSWGYRQLYSGKIKRLDIPGKIIIPRSEIDRLLGETTVHGGASE